MDFRFTPDELEVHRYARTSVRTHLPLSRLADPEAEVAGWAAFAADGWTQACLGEDGPSDLPFLAGLARESGGMAAGEGFVHNGWLLPKLCAHAGEASRAEWLAELRSRPGFLTDPDGVRPGMIAADQVRAARPGFDDYELESGVEGVRRLRRRPPSDAGVTALGGLSVQLGRAATGEDCGPVLELTITDDELAELRSGAHVLRAAALIGLASEILATTIGYVGEREQFGQVIGKFQAVKHLCADVHAQIQVAWLAVLHAGVAADDTLAVDSASYLATTTALDAARVGAQLHGGMGFTWESNLHWLLKAALDGQVTAGPPGSVAHRIGAAMVGQA